MRTASSSAPDRRERRVDADIADRLRTIALATEVESATSFRFAGQRYTADIANQVMRPDVNFGHAQQATDAPILALLAETLYQRAYCARFDPRLNGQHNAETEWSADDTTRFQRDLSDANTGQEVWDLGWRAHDVLSGGQVVAAKGDALRTFQAGEYLATGAYTIGVLPGQLLRIPVPRDSWLAQPGYYYVFGPVLGDSADDLDIVRLYWNVRASGSAAMVRALTSHLNRYAIPFKYKCPMHPAAYSRVDGNVLFIARRFYRLVAMVLEKICASVAAHLDDDVPLFTHRLRPGLSVAEDPGTGESFGMHRMRLVASGLWAAHRARTRHADGRVQAIDAAFRTAGYSLAAPHLNSGSHTVYALPH